MTHHDDGTSRLTHDELKAAEAAFQGRAFNEAWSQAARNVYIGIRVAMMKVDQQRLMEEVRDTDRHPLAPEDLRGGVLV
ncbi:MAG TPA: hypothetical protein VKB81_10950 [Nitrospira sp.]|nr:hypothetical protein [Nitrospira sp.]